jgi:hypothetical protein
MAREVPVTVVGGPDEINGQVIMCPLQFDNKPRFDFIWDEFPKMAPSLSSAEEVCNLEVKRHRFTLSTHYCGNDVFFYYEYCDNLVQPDLTRSHQILALLKKHFYGINDMINELERDGRI